GLFVRVMKPRRWNLLETEIVYRTPIFDLHRRHSGHPHRGKRDFFVIDAPHWVNIIPLTATGAVVMGKQFRHGIRRFTLDLPGAMVDPEEGPPKRAGGREMAKESGSGPRRVSCWGRVKPSPAIEENSCYTFRARDGRLLAKPQLGGAEEAGVVLVPLRTI